MRDEFQKDPKDSRNVKYSASSKSTAGTQCLESTTNTSKILPYLKLWQEVKAICEENHPSTDPCFSMADFDINFMFQSANFMKIDCPAVEYYNKVFGRLNIAEYLVSVDKKEPNAPIEAKETSSKLEKLVAKVVDREFVAMSTQHISTARMSTLDHPARQLSQTNPHHVKFAREVTYFMNLVKMVFYRLPTQLEMMECKIGNLRKPPKTKDHDDQSRIDYLHALVWESLDLAEELTATSDMVVEIFDFENRMRALQLTSHKDKKLLEGLGQFSAQYINIKAMYPFCDYNRVIEGVSRLLENVSLALDEIDRGGDIQMSDSDVTGDLENSELELIT